MLPAPFSSYARVLFNLLFLRKEHQQLLVLREQAVQALKRKLAFPLEQDMRRHMVDLMPPMFGILDARQRIAQGFADLYCRPYAGRIRERKQKYNSKQFSISLVPIKSSVD